MTIGIIGAGGVGQALAKRLSEKGHKVYLVHRPHQRVVGDFVLLTAWEALPWNSMEALLLCVRDRQIAPLAAAIAQKADPTLPIAHTAGSVSIDTLRDFVRKGVVYPLQTFSPGISIEWGSFPVFWEGDEIFYEIAGMLTGDSRQVHFANSVERLRLHIGAVFVANFTNALVGIAQKIIEPRWDRFVYLPLLETVVRKLYFLSPEQAQTGPARRKDEETIQKHLAYLRTEWPEMATLYEAITRYIQAQSLQ